ncbi:MAG: hypothetical protein GY906_13355 [bacterium]|nr:hypothetical protein [bacterium]
MADSISEMNGDELFALIRRDDLNEGDLLEVLRNPFCTVEIAEKIASSSSWLSSQVVRERLTGFRGLPVGRAMNLMSTLPWTSLLLLAQAPRTAPVVRRHAERRLRYRVPKLSLGEKIALARRAHRPLFTVLIKTGDLQILVALLDNPRLVENDLFVVVNSSNPPQEFYAEILRHRRWGQSYKIRSALARDERVPLPLALSVLVQLRPSDIRRIAQQSGVSDSIRDAARALCQKEDREH